MPQETPTVVIVGRPNVGKSTLFNRITHGRRSIVGDEPGITRDRISGAANFEGRRFELVDTGGIAVNDAAYIPTQILKQAKVALEQAARVLFVVDGRAEITSADRELAQLLRKTGKPVTLAVNKVDTGAKEALVHDFYELGIKDMYPVSAEHGLGMDALMLHITEGFPEGTEEELRQDAGGRPSEEAEEKIAAGPIKVAIIGRPNAGKSTLLNALVGEERAIVSPIAGTTRDAVDETVSLDGIDYVFVDTAGIRRKGKTHLMAEKLSVVMARKHLKMSNVAILVLDGSEEEGCGALDATIA